MEPEFPSENFGDLQKGSAERDFLEICSENRSEEIGTNRGIPENKDRKSRNKPEENAGKSEQIGVAPFW